MKKTLMLILMFSLSACNLRLKPATDPFYSLVLDQNPDNQAALYGQGQNLIRQGRYEEALKYFDRLVKGAPGESKAWFDQGRCLFELHRFKEAKKAFERAIAIDPNREAYLALALATLMNGEIQPTRELAQIIEKEYGSTAALLRLRGDTAFVSGDFRAALRLYQESLRKNPNEQGVQDHIRDLQDFLTSPR